MSEVNHQADEPVEFGWAEHRKRQLRRLARLSLEEKLRWLEDAQELGHRLIAQGRTERKARRSAPESDAGR